METKQTEATKKTTAIAIAKKSEIETVKDSPADRFTAKVMLEFPNGGSKKLQLTTLQKKLINNYFIKLDGVLKDGEVKRLAKTEQYRDALEFTWQNVNMNKLAQDVVAYSEIGLDPLQPNHINPIPYKNSKTNKFDITFIPGYDGIEIKAKKYGLDAPDTAIIELVYTTDDFKAVKKDKDNPVETYKFNITDEFDRGEVKGGFYYHIYKNNPEKNKLVLLSKKDIEKRKPTYASAEFWGGEKDKWENGKRVGKENIDGWYDEMAWKTVKRACWGSINIDPEKIDDNLQRLLQNDIESVSNRVNKDVNDNANDEIIDMGLAEEVETKKISSVNTTTGEITELGF